LTLINAVTGTGTVKIDFANGATGLNTKLAGVNDFGGTIQLSNTGAGGTKDKFSVGGVTAPGASVIIDPGTQVFLNGSATFKSIQVSGTGNTETRGAIRLTTGTLTVINGLMLMGDTAIGPEGGTLAGDISSGVAGTVTLTMGATSSTGNATINGIISDGLGSIALTKTAAGTVTLTAANTYTGLTTVSAGTLAIGNGGTTGALSPLSAITNDGTLRFNRSDTVTQGTDFASVISGLGQVTQAGTGTVVLSSANTYAGATTITGGTLIASTIVDGGPSSLGGGTAITLSGPAANNATLKYTGGSVTITRAVTVTNTTGNTGTLEITDPGTKLTINAKVASGGNYPIFYKDGPGTLELGGGDPAGNTMDNTSLYLQVRQGTVIMNKTGLNTNRACARLGGVSAGATVQLGDSSNGDQIYAFVQGMDGTLDMNGQNETVTGFSSAAGVTTGNLTNTKPASSSTLTISAAGTFEGTVTDGAGTVALIKSGTGTLTLAGTTANTYTGMTTVSGGELDLFKTGVNAIGGDVTLSSGTLKFLAAEQIINSALIVQTAGTCDLNGMTETIASYSKSGGTFRTGMGGHLIGAGPTLTFAGGTLLLPDIIDADATVEDAHVVLGSGEVLTALGANDASYGGSPGAVGGILKVAAGGAGLEMTGATLTLNSDSTGAGSLQLFGDVTTLASSATSTIVNGAGDSAAVSGLIDLEGGVRTFTVAQGTVPSGEDLSISAVIKNGGLAKDGTGRLVLTGVNTYSGKTTILKGILEIKGAGSISLSPVIELKAGATLDVTNAVPSLWSLAMGQTLTGGGTVSGNMAVGSGATLSPGGSPGTLTHGPGDETWAGGGTYLWEVNKVDPSVVMQPAGLQGQDPGFDFVSIAGQLQIAATSGQKFTLDIAGLNETTGGEGAVTAWDSLKPYEWVVATAAGGITGFDPDKFDVQWTKFASNNPMAGGTTFIVRQEGNSVVVAYVPEPATLALLGLGGLALLLNRKRK